MRTSSFFGQLRSAYASEIDDMTFDSEGKTYCASAWPPAAKSCLFCAR